MVGENERKCEKREGEKREVVIWGVRPPIKSLTIRTKKGGLIMRYC